MDFSIVDIGSNSIRMLLNGEKTTRNVFLASNLERRGFRLDPDAVDRALGAIEELRDLSRSAGVEKIFAFATETIRRAVDSSEFIRRVEALGIDVEPISSELEAELGFRGAYVGPGPVAVLDVGGASAELAIGDETGVSCVRSLKTGCVRLRDAAETDAERRRIARKAVSELGAVPRFDRLIGIGGAMTQLCAAHFGIAPYDPKIVHGSVLTRSDIASVARRISALPVERRAEIKGLDPERAVVAPIGGIIVEEFMRRLNADRITVSESDNLEGYAEYLAEKGAV